MKTLFSRRHNRRQRNALLGAGVRLGPLSAGILVVLALFLVLRLVAPGALAALLTPLWGAGNTLTAATGNSTSFFTSAVALQKERDQLRASEVALMNKNAVLETRIRDLERLLGDRSEGNDGILASTLIRPPVSPYDVLVVDRGSDDGVGQGALVRAQGGVPVGRIESVTRATARVLLFSSPGVESEGWVGDARLPITLKGKGSGAFSAEVSRDAGIVAGEFVYLPGEGAVPVGTIRNIVSDPSSPRARVDIVPMVNPFSITWVTIAP